uniref:Trafficking protein particle complex subunit 11 domain-containing protein n=1 Tax=Trichuris muris TaxID=70415 RepID=A0A5S6QBV9_TRIMR
MLRHPLFSWSGSASAFGRFSSYYGNEFGRLRCTVPLKEEDDQLVITLNNLQWRKFDGCPCQDGWVGFPLGALLHVFFIDESQYGHEENPNVLEELLEWTGRMEDAESYVIFVNYEKRSSFKSGIKLSDKLDYLLGNFRDRVVFVSGGEYKTGFVLNEFQRRIVASVGFVVRKQICRIRLLMESCLQMDWDFGEYVLSKLQLASLYFSFGKGILVLKHLNELDASIKSAIHHALVASKGCDGVRVSWLEKLVKGFWLKPFCSYVGLTDCMQRLPDVTVNAVQCYRLRDIRLLMFTFQAAVLLHSFNGGFHSSNDYPTSLNKVDIFRLCNNMLTALTTEESLLTKNPSGMNISLSLWGTKILLEAMELVLGGVLTKDFYSICTLCPSVLVTLNNFVSTIGNNVHAFSQPLSPSPSTSQQRNLAEKLECKLLSELVKSAAAFSQVYSELTGKSVEVMKSAKWPRHALLLNLRFARFLKNCGEFEKCALVYREVLFELRKDGWLALYRMLLSEAEDILIHFSELLSFEFTSPCVGDSSAELSPNGQFPERTWLTEGSRTDLLAIAGNGQRSEGACNGKIISDHNASVQSTFPKRRGDVLQSLCNLADGTNSQRSFVTSKRVHVVLKPGSNEVVFSAQIPDVGLYLPDHIHVESEWGSYTHPLERSISKATIFRCTPPKCRLTLPNRDKNDRKDFIFGGVLQPVILLLEWVPPSCYSHSGNCSIQLQSVDRLLQFEDPSAQILEQAAVLLPTVCGEQRLTYRVNVFCRNPVGGKQSVSMIVRFGRWSFEMSLIVRQIFDCMSSLKMVSSESALFSVTFTNRYPLTIIPLMPHIHDRNAMTATEHEFELVNEEVKAFQTFCPNTFVWKLNSSLAVQAALQLSYTVSGSEKLYTYEACFDLKVPVIVEAYGSITSDVAVYRVNCFYEFAVVLKCRSLLLRSDKVRLWLADQIKGCWTFRHENEAHVAPAIAGYLPLPVVEMETDSVNFPNVQLCYRSRAKQVHVVAAAEYFKQIIKRSAQ